MDFKEQSHVCDSVEWLTRKLLSDHRPTWRTPPHPSGAAQGVLSSLRSLVSHQGFDLSSCGVQRTLWYVPETKTSPLRHDPSAVQ